MKKSTIDKFVIYSSELIPDGCIFFCHPKDEQILIEAISTLEDMPLTNKQKTLVHEFMRQQLKLNLVEIKEEP